MCVFKIAAADRIRNIFEGNLPYAFFFKIDLFILKAELWRERKKIFHPLVHSSSACSGQGCTRPKPRASTGLPFVFRGPNTWAVVHCFPRCTSGELDWKWSCVGSNQRLYGKPALRINSLYHNTRPGYVFKYLRVIAISLYFFFGKIPTFHWQNRQ